MISRVRDSWRLITVVASVAAAALAFRYAMPVFGTPLGNSSGLVGAIPIGMAAWLFGPRAAVVTMIAAGVLDIGLVNSGDPASPPSLLSVIEGAFLAFAAIVVGGAMAARRRLTHALSTDIVTGLPNAQAFTRDIERRMRRHEDGLVVAMLDLEDVNAVTEMFGHDVNDELMRKVAQRLVEIAGPHGVATKGVRDRFAIVWPSSALTDEAIAEQLLAAGQAAFALEGGGALRIRSRVSITRWSVTRSDNVTQLVRAAQAAIESAEHAGESWAAAKPISATDGANRLETLRELSLAINDGDLRLHYQPIMELPSRSVRGFEALVRWKHATRGLVPPALFISLAELGGLIVPLTEWVISEAMRQSRVWAEGGLRTQISINVGASVLSPVVDLPGLFDRLAKQHGVELSSFSIEVTETDVMRDPVRSVAILGELKARGLRIELDDFGTGYSSLAYLQNLPLDAVKIDRSFILMLLSDNGTAAIVRAAIDLAHALGLEAIGEGVEDEAVVERLAAQGCDATQGFFFARPMAAHLVPAWMKDHTASVEVVNAPMTLARGAHGGTILVVDDEHRLRVAAHRMLVAGGHRVISVATASQALQMCSMLGNDIKLVLTDVFLTDWRGPDLVARLREKRPDLLAMFMSGDSLGNRTTGADSFLQKPFSKQQLLAEVARVLPPSVNEPVAAIA
ncbi:MAG: EAL domain-containing protein [Chloroflexota bacterium]|nr:EAL domain-containing protein [Chloroflexota bacterium]